MLCLVELPHQNTKHLTERGPVSHMVKANEAQYEDDTVSMLVVSQTHRNKLLKTECLYDNYVSQVDCGCVEFNILPKKQLCYRMVGESKIMLHFMESYNFRTSCEATRCLDKTWVEIGLPEIVPITVKGNVVCWDHYHYHRVYGLAGGSEIIDFHGSPYKRMILVWIAFNW